MNRDEFYEFQYITYFLLVMVLVLMVAGCSAFDSRNSGGKNWSSVSYGVGKVINDGGSSPRPDIRH